MAFPKEDALATAPIMARDGSSADSPSEKQRAGDEKKLTPGIITAKEAYALIEKSHQLVKGISTKKDVEKLLGRPTRMINKQGVTDPSGDLWIYGGDWRPWVVVWFDGDKYRDAGIEIGCY